MGKALDPGPGLRVKGLAELRRAVRKVDRDLDKDLTRGVRELGKRVRDRARANAPERSGALKRSVKHSVTAKAASVYSNLEYAYIIERGGRVGNGGVFPRAKAYRYLDKAVTESRGDIDRTIADLLESIGHAWES